MQELIFKIQPDVIIETGNVYGSSLIYYTLLLGLLDKGKVIGIDIEIREHNRRVIERHPMFNRIELIEGSSIFEEIIEEIRKMVPKDSKVIVCLDSNHIKNHVLKELQLYNNFVNLGSYIVVSDTITSKMARLGACEKRYINNGPKEAVEDFLKVNNNFEIDKHYNKLYISYSPNGYLRRK